MSSIYDLPLADTASSGQQLALYDPVEGDSRKLSIASLQTYLEANMALGRPEADTQYAAPSATGFSVQIQNDDKDVHLILTPVAGYAAGTIVLPLNTLLRDKQEITVNTTQAVTTLTISLNGASGAIGAPTTLAANAYFKLKYDLATNNWYRVG